MILFTKRCSTAAISIILLLLIANNGFAQNNSNLPSMTIGLSGGIIGGKDIENIFAKTPIFAFGFDASLLALSTDKNHGSYMTLHYTMCSKNSTSENILSGGFRYVTAIDNSDLYSRDRKFIRMWGGAGVSYITANINNQNDTEVVSGSDTGFYIEAGLCIENFSNFYLKSKQNWASVYSGWSILCGFEIMSKK